MRQSVKRRVWSRVGVVAAVAVGAIGLSFAPAGAVTNTTIGHAQWSGPYICAQGFQWVQASSASPSYVVPAGGGAITSWSSQTGDSDSSLALEVWRPAGGDNFTLVGVSAQQTFPANSGVVTYPVSPPIVVQAGDVLGLYAVSVSRCLNYSGNGGDNAMATLYGPPPAVGTTVNFPYTDYGTYQLNVSATVGPLCSVGLTAHVLAASTNTGPIAGLFCVNAQGIGTYTQDGRIAPGRIIKVGNILWFQADGNNLRNSGHLNTANGASSFVQTKPISATGKVTSLT